MYNKRGVWRLGVTVTAVSHNQTKNEKDIVGFTATALKTTYVQISTVDIVHVSSVKQN
jgi:methylaspartate ammonia-lyase